MKKYFKKSSFWY